MWPQVVPASRSRPRLPLPGTPAPTRPLGNSRLRGAAGERPSLGLALLLACLSHLILPDRPSAGTNTGALFPKMGPCLGAWPWAQVGGRNKTQRRRGGVPSAAKAASLGMPAAPWPSLRWDRGR